MHLAVLAGQHQPGPVVAAVGVGDPVRLVEHQEVAAHRRLLHGAADDRGVRVDLLLAGGEADGAGRAAARTAARRPRAPAGAAARRRRRGRSSPARAGSRRSCRSWSGRGGRRPARGGWCAPGSSGSAPSTQLCWAQALDAGGGAVVVAGAALAGVGALHGGVRGTSGHHSQVGTGLRQEKVGAGRRELSRTLRGVTAGLRRTCPGAVRRVRGGRVPRASAAPADHCESGHSSSGVPRTGICGRAARSIPTHCDRRGLILARCTCAGLLAAPRAADWPPSPAPGWLRPRWRARLPPRTRPPARPGAVPSVFLHGVASGDPLPEAVVLWTRVTPNAAATPGSGVGPAVTVEWEIAADDDFDRIVLHGETRTGPEQDHTVKVDARGLDPATTYWYRFRRPGDDVARRSHAHRARRGRRRAAAADGRRLLRQHAGRLVHRLPSPRRAARPRSGRPPRRLLLRVRPAAR